MHILNEYTKVAYSDGWMFFGIVFVFLLVYLLVFTVNKIVDGYGGLRQAFAMTLLLAVCVGGIYGSFTMANKGEEHYIQCTIDDDYPASDLLRYEIVKTEGKIVTLKEKDGE